MPKSGATGPSNSQISASLSERFPSLKRWEASCEKPIDLASIRTQAGKLRQMSDLISQSIKRCPELFAERGHLEMQDEKLRNLIATLDLEPTSADKLLEDTTLIAAWYLHPQRRAALRFDTQQHIAAMGTVARKARRLYLTLSTDLMGLETLLQTLVDEGEPGLDDVDLRQFATQLASFSTMARRAVAAAKPGRGGRQSDDRRNQALALMIMATERATGARICTSRVNDIWRFTTQPGQFVRDVFATLGWPDERVLVGAVKRISGSPRRTKA